MFILNESASSHPYGDLAGYSQEELLIGMQEDLQMYMDSVISCMREEASIGLSEEADDKTDKKASLWQKMKGGVVAAIKAIKSFIVKTGAWIFNALNDGISHYELPGGEKGLANYGLFNASRLKAFGCADAYFKNPSEEAENKITEALKIKEEPFSFSKLRVAKISRNTLKTLINKEIENVKKMTDMSLRIANTYTPTSETQHIFTMFTVQIPKQARSDMQELLKVIRQIAKNHTGFASVAGIEGEEHLKDPKEDKKDDSKK